MQKAPYYQGALKTKRRDPPRVHAFQVEIIVEIIYRIKRARSVTLSFDSIWMFSFYVSISILLYERILFLLSMTLE